MARKIVWTHSALNSKNQILIYWLNRNQSTAYPRKLDRIFHQLANLISKYPMMGRKTTRENVRSRHVKDYLIFYRFTESKVEILLIWDTRRDPKHNPFTN